jgi:hypothetical protein
MKTWVVRFARKRNEKFRDILKKVGQNLHINLEDMYV